MSDSLFTNEQLAIIRFAAIECEHQMSGERSVSWMLNAYNYAYRGSRERFPTEVDVLVMASLIEPGKNAAGYRQAAIQVGRDVREDWTIIPRQMANLMEAVERLTPEEWYYHFEDCHPFLDGNGRVGVITFNWLRGSLNDPELAPNFWGDDAVDKALITPIGVD